MPRRDPHWQQRPFEDFVTWHPVEPPRAVEGPLSLEFFRDQTLVLELAPHQLAFREADGRLQQVYFDGLHELAVGHGPGQVEPDSRLFFLRGDVPLTWRWRDGTSLRVNGGHEPGILVPLRGACSVVIDDPAGFHGAVLDGLESLDDATLIRTLDTLVRTQLETRLEPLVENRSLDPVRVQIMLDGLRTEDLDEDLLELGLRCVHVAAGTLVRHEEPLVAPENAELPIGSYDDVF